MPSPHCRAVDLHVRSPPPARCPASQGGLCAYVVDGQLRNASMDGVSRGERSAFLRAGRSVDEEEAAADGLPQPGLDAAFRNVELLEESLKQKEGSA